jgi:hypothetical protein
VPQQSRFREVQAVAKRRNPHRAPVPDGPDLYGLAGPSPRLRQLAHRIASWQFPPPAERGEDGAQPGAGLWTNKDTFSVRTSAGGLDQAGRVVSVILNSARLNPKWVEGEIRGQIQRNEIALHTQQEIQRLDQEIVEHRRRTNAEINNQMYHNLMRTEEYVNPLTKEVEVGSNEWSYRWVNDRGEAIYTDDQNFNPERAGLRGFVRSPVRKRFPDR